MLLCEFRFGALLFLSPLPFFSTSTAICLMNRERADDAMNPCHSFIRSFVKMCMPAHSLSLFLVLCLMEYWTCLEANVWETLWSPKGDWFVDRINVLTYYGNKADQFSQTMFKYKFGLICLQYTKMYESSKQILTQSFLQKNFNLFFYLCLECLYLELYWKIVFGFSFGPINMNILYSPISLEFISWNIRL